MHMTFITEKQKYIHMKEDNSEFYFVYMVGINK